MEAQLEYDAELDRIRGRAADRGRIAALAKEPEGSHLDIDISLYACPASARSAIYAAARKHGLRVTLRGLAAEGQPTSRGERPRSYRVFKESSG